MDRLVLTFKPVEFSVWMKLILQTRLHLLLKYSVSGSFLCVKGQGWNPLLKMCNLEAIAGIALETATVMDTATGAQDNFRKSMFPHQKRSPGLYHTEGKPFINVVQKNKKTLWKSLDSNSSERKRKTMETWSVVRTAPPQSVPGKEKGRCQIAHVSLKKDQSVNNERCKSQHL